jgi:hypothetical protein
MQDGKPSKFVELPGHVQEFLCGLTEEDIARMERAKKVADAIEAGTWVVAWTFAFLAALGTGITAISLGWDELVRRWPWR